MWLACVYNTLAGQTSAEGENRETPLLHLQTLGPGLATRGRLSQF